MNDAIYRLKREAVLRESGRIFSRRGYHNTSLDDVAKALNVSKGTLYNYVKDKQEILFECQKMALDIAERSFDYAEQNATNGADKLRLVIRQYIATLTEEMGACGVITEVGALRPADRKAIVARRDQFEERFVALIDEGMADGSLRPIDPKLAVYTFMGAVHAVPGWYSPKGRLPAEAIADGMADLLLAGMTAPGAASTVKTPPAEAKPKAVTRKRRPTVITAE
ncbi:TetR/AcrR family transcriptional regulator [Azospirillum sp. HJ39]|uniref:TetR/AcrR family transcriptional regulator n=1 Tax=Azospirillum sp. HJ39 TaxID=3159496 RepID=UPI0035562477